MTSNPSPNASPPLGELLTVDRVGENPVTNTWYWQHDHEYADSFAEFVIASVSESIGADPLEMELLCDAVDPEILQRLSRSQPRSQVEVHFTWNGHDVTVTSDGGVLVHVEE